jgi:phage baseplate assembly protein W
MVKAFLGRGLSFPIRQEREGNFQTADYEESVRQSVFLILSTAKGERVMRPDFGCGIYDLVFELKTATTEARIIQEVQDALLRFEPRIDVLGVRVNPTTDSAGETLIIAIDYEVRATNNVFNLVYPFYLEGVQTNG